MVQTIGIEGGSVFDFLGQSGIVIYAAYALVGGAVFILTRMFVQEMDVRSAEQSLEDLKGRKASNGLVRVTRPFFTQYVVPMIRGKPFWDDRRRFYRRRLVTAGLKEELTPDEFIAFKFFLILFFPVVAALMRITDIYPFEWYMVIGSGVAGWFYPDLWIRQRITARQKQILKDLPFIVDLLALSTEAGMDFIGAIGRVVEKSTPGPLVDEFEQLLKEIKVGSSRGDALREMALRIDMIEVGSFISILISADQMGASIGKILRQQSDQIRSERLIRAEKAGAAATPKLIAATVIFILPAVVMMAAGPFLISMIGGGQ